MDDVRPGDGPRRRSEVFKIPAQVIRRNFKAKKPIQKPRPEILQFPIIDERGIIDCAVEAVAFLETDRSSTVQFRQELHNLPVKRQKVPAQPPGTSLQVNVSQVLEQKNPLRRISPIEVGYRQPTLRKMPADQPVGIVFVKAGDVTAR